jgi:hypothetical protein
LLGAASLGAGLGAWKVPSTLGAPASTHWEGIPSSREEIRDGDGDGDVDSDTKRVVKLVV